MRVLKDDRRALVVAAGAAQRAADYVLDRQPARTTDDRAVERDREQELGAQRDNDGREAVEALKMPTAALEETRVLVEADRGPEEVR